MTLPAVLRCRAPTATRQLIPAFRMLHKLNYDNYCGRAPSVVLTLHHRLLHLKGGQLHTCAAHYYPIRGPIPTFRSTNWFIYVL